MVELEIQVLAHARDGLLVEVGRLASQAGFTLARQRLVQDPHGTLLSMVVRGSWFRKRALRAALETSERLISFEIHPWKDGEERAHFAATRHLNSGYVPPPPAAPPAPARAAGPAPAVPPSITPPPIAPVQAVPVSAVPALAAAGMEPPEPQPLLPEPIAPFLAVPAAAVAPADRFARVAEPEAEAWVEPEVLAADAAAVETLLADSAEIWPRILPRLLELDRQVAPGAREATLELAGRRLGAWLFEREYALDTGLALEAALEGIAAPALRALVEVDLVDGQLRIHASPLCGTPGHSGCGFFSGFLEGLLKGTVDSRRLAVFPVCCASFGADECVFAISD